MQQLASGARSTVTPSPQSGLVDRVIQYGRDYLGGLNQAGAALSQPSNDIPGVGTAEMLGSFATGIVSPIPAALESAAIGTPYRQARAKYVYQPQTQSGRAMTGGAGALTRPVGDILEWGGKTVGNALDYVPGVSREAGQEAGAATVDALGLASTVRGLMKAPASQAPKRQTQPIPSTAELKAAKDAAYARANSAGVVVRPDSFAKFTDDVSAELTKLHLNEKLHPGTAAALDELNGTAKRGAALTLEELDQLRQIVRDAPKGKADGRLGGMIVKRLDSYIDNLKGKDLVAGDAPEASAALKQARDLNRRMSNSAMFDELLRKAGIQATAKFTQAGEEHAVRSEFKKLALNTKAMQKFTTIERAAIEKVAKGGSFENAMRDLGKFDPLQGGMASMVSAVTGGSLGGLGFLMAGPEASALGLAIPVGGYVGRKIATGLTKRNAGLAREALVGRGLPPRGLLSTAPANVAQPVVVPPGLLQSGILAQRER
jgi:hypothetical protein